MPLMTGCGNEDLPVYPVAGGVRFQGKPAAGAEVIFHPLSGPAKGTRLRPNGRADEFGKFALGTYRAGDGAPAGEYRIGVVWPGPLPNAAPGDSEASHGGPDRLRGRYGDPEKSGLKATVSDSNNELPPLELK
ncbi:MAG: hypothetical protein IT426_03465 [Pirellulales bacterium]|nr:hypothetical protein [Pirellulales bacterium]